MIVSNFVRRLMVLVGFLAFSLIIWTDWAAFAVAYQVPVYTVPAIGIAGFVVAFLGSAFGLLRIKTDRKSALLMNREDAAENLFTSLIGSNVYAVTLLRAQRNVAGLLVDFTIVHINDQACALRRMNAKNFAGMTFAEATGTEITPDLLSRFNSTIQSRQAFEHEIELRYSDGQSCWLRQQVLPVGDAIVLIEIDISDRKNNEAENRSNNAFLQTLIDYLPAAVYAHSMRDIDRGKMVVWNKAAEIVTGYSGVTILGKNFNDVFPGEIAAVYRDAAERMASDPMVVDLPEQPLLRPDGERRYLREISVPLFNDAGEVDYVLGISEDITARRKQELALRTKQAELAATNDASPLGLFRIDPEGHCIYINRTCEEMSGLVGLETIGRSWIELVHPDDRWMLLRAWRRTTRHRETFQGVYRFIRPDDHMIWVSLKIAPIVVDDDIKGYTGTIDDITNRRSAELALQESEQHLRTIADTIPALVAYVSADERFRFTNAAYESAFGVTRDRLRGMGMREVFGEPLYAQVSTHVTKALSGEKVVFEIDEQRNGMYRCIEATYTPQVTSDGSKRVIGFHIMETDITAKKLHERRLVQMTKIDSLTGLLNRAGFEQKLSEAMNTSGKKNILMAIMYLDIDRFKLINDTYGHPVGDSLLKSFVGRLVRALRATDSVSRLGGDEFTVIMENLASLHDAEQIAAKVRQAMQPSFIIENHTVHVTTSIGIAYYRGADISAQTLVRQADDMLYAAKQAGRNTYRIAALQEDD